jgi:Uma2 family endonuclease
MRVALHWPRVMLRLDFAARVLIFRGYMRTQTLDYLDAIGHLPEGGTLILQHVSWGDYEQLLAELGNSPGVRVHYDNGRLEIMAPLQEHEACGEMIGSMVRVLTRELRLKLESRGSATLKRETQAKGVEPDGSFYIRHATSIIGKRRIDLNIDPPPDLVVEIDLTNESLTKFPIYQALGVPEIWRYDAESTEFHRLEAGRYLVSPMSRAFPFLASSVISQFLELSKTAGQDEALDAFRHWVQTHKP